MPKKDKKTLEFSKFKTSTIVPGMICALVGKRGSGKSYLIRHILYEMREEFDTAIVFSNTERMTGWFINFIPDTFIYDKYDPDRMKVIIESQETRIRQLSCKNCNKCPECKSTRMVLILDDILPDSATIVKDPAVAELFFNGRHYNITLFISIQYCIALPPKFRTNVDIVFAWAEVIYSNKKRLYEHYFGMFRTFREFETIFDSLTNGNDFVVAKLSRMTSKSLNQLVWWGSAKEVPPFKLGSEAFWNFHRRRNVQFANQTLIRNNRRVEA